MISREKKLEIIRSIREGDLKRPASFDTCNIELLLIVCNGCGSAQASFDYIPDTIYGLDVSPACFIHDYEYYLGEDKIKADNNIRDNINTLISRASVWLRGIRRARAAWYYYLPKWMGGSSFGK